MIKTTTNTHDLVTGNPKTLLVTVKLNKSPAVIPIATQVKAVLHNSTAINPAPITCLSTMPGANWALGIIAIPFTAAQIPGDGTYTLEIEALGIETWFADGIMVRQGLIA